MSGDQDRWWAGRLLVSTPSLLDPNFRRSVVLLLDHDEDGALGVVLDRPLELGVGEVLPGWEGAVTPPDVLFGGGPVSTGAALGVAVLASGTTAAPLGWRRMFDDTGLIDLDTPVEVVADAFAAMRIFAGYSGWGAGQLEAEIQEGAWVVLRAEPGDLATTAPGLLWRSIWRRQPGRLALLADFPEDASLN